MKAEINASLNLYPQTNKLHDIHQDNKNMFLSSVVHFSCCSSLSLVHDGSIAFLWTRHGENNELDKPNICFGFIVSDREEEQKDTASGDITPTIDTVYGDCTECMVDGMRYSTTS